MDRKNLSVKLKKLKKESKPFERVREKKFLLLSKIQSLKLFFKTNKLPILHFNRGIALKNLKRYDEALLEYERAIKVEKTSKLCHPGRGRRKRRKRKNFLLLCKNYFLKLFFKTK